jgi:hypothetical protein
VLVLICVSTAGLVAAQPAAAKVPKWFAREAAGKLEHEFTGTVNLKPVVALTKINFYIESSPSKDLADGCNKSSVEGVSVTGGEPGTMKIKKLVLSGCEEALSEPCTVKSSSESVTLENLSGELVYYKSKSAVAVKFQPVEFLIGVKCKSAPRCPGMGETEHVKTEFLLHLANSFAFTSEFLDTASLLFTEYETNSTGTKTEVQNTATGRIEGDVAAYEFELREKPAEGTPAEDSEFKAE